MTFWKKSVFLALGQFTRDQSWGLQYFTKNLLKLFYLQLNCIGKSDVRLIILTGCAWVWRMFFISITFATNEKEFIWGWRKSPCRFCQKSLFEDGARNGSCPKSLLKSQIIHVLSLSDSDARLSACGRLVNVM